jgi:hypothetical protein
MTIALGFNCPDGLVLCTDSLESDGSTKSLVDKIWCYETQGEWGIAVASAGEADFAESFTDNLRTLFTGESFNNLSGRVKSGQWWSGQNRPTDVARNVVLLS